MLRSNGRLRAIEVLSSAHRAVITVLAHDWCMDDQSFDNNDEWTMSADADTHALDRAKTMGHLLDDAFRVPGTDFRVGLDPILGILPVGGDLAAAAASMYIVFEAFRAGAPRDVIGKMTALVAVDLVIGSIPVLGVVFDAFWKANKWNLSMLESHVEAN